MPSSASVDSGDAVSPASAMNDKQLQSVRRHFIEYANSHIGKAGDMRHMMELKREHCAFVARNCRELATVSEWPQEDVNTAEALGYLHDIGRFPQLEEYGTFMDSKSIDHGERGWKALQESNLLDDVEPDLREALLCGVRQHNKRDVADDLPQAHYQWVYLIRDADRLDIYRVVYAAIINEKLEEHPEIGLGLPLEGDPSEELLAKILSGGAPAYDELKCFNDFLLCILSWINHMNYPAALKIVRERNILENFAAYLPVELPQVAAVLAVFRKTVDAA